MDTSYEWLTYGAAAGVIGGAGIWLGEVLGLGTSAKLFTITFMLVFAGGKNPVRALSPVAPCARGRASPGGPLRESR